MKAETPGCGTGLRRPLAVALLVALIVGTVPTLATAQVEDAPPVTGDAPADEEATSHPRTPVPATDALTVLTPAEQAARARWAAHTSGLLVTTDDDQDPAEVAARAGELLGIEVRVDRSLDDDTVVLSLDGDVPREQVEAAAARLEAEGRAVAADPDTRIFTTAAPNDPEYERQWALHGRHGAQTVRGIDVERAWERTVGSPDVVIAVLDTGILAHPDLDDRIVAGYNFVEGNDDPTDRGLDCDPVPGQPVPTTPMWHGLHVAGIVGAVTDNGVGIAGVDQRARIQPIRVLSDCGGTTSDLIDAIRWAAGLSVPGVPSNPTPADVVNLSLGGYARSCPGPMHAAIRAANDRGVVVVAAVGNDNVDLGDRAFIPASCAGTIAVSAVGPRGYRAGRVNGTSRVPYANHGSRVDVSAPGGDPSFRDAPSEPWGAILSLGPDAGYSYKFGTSMAAPQVAGVAALLNARDPAIRPAQVRRLLMDTAQPFPLDTPGANWRCGGRVIRCGAGILDAGAALATNPTPAPRFSDAGGEHAAGIAWMAEEGITLGCDSSGRRFCPNDRVTRAQMASFLARALQLTDGRERTFVDVDAGHRHAATIDALRRERITNGCRSGSRPRYCPSDSVTREEMASLIRRAESYDPGSTSWFVDVSSGNTHASSIGALAREGVTVGCDSSGRRFCPKRPVTRGQMATFLHRALG